MSNHPQQTQLIPMAEASPAGQTSEMQVKSPNPISEVVVGIIAERALGIKRPWAFGTSEDFEKLGHEALLPALAKTTVRDTPFLVTIGSPQCKQPYQASLLNCSALSFGPMGKNFILALNQAAHLGGFYQNTGEAGLSPFHFGVDVDIEAPDFNAEAFFAGVKQNAFAEALEAGDLVWQIGNGYFGCRTPDGYFDPLQFAEKATLNNVKMIEIKLSQGVEPCKTMPVPRVTTGMAKLMGLPSTDQARLQNEHSAFSSPVGLLRFVQQLRELSGGKPVGIKTGISHRYYFLAICKAMLQTGIVPDFITVDGMEAGTAAASIGTTGFTGTSLNESILFVHNALVGIQMRKHIKIIASGRVFTEQDIITKLARGADLCLTARGMLLAVGCDQQRECYKGLCTKGIATQDPSLLKRFNIRENAIRLYHYHKLTIEELMELFSIAGVNHPDQIAPHMIQKRISTVEVKPLNEIYDFIKPGSLLTIWPWRIPKAFRQAWRFAKPDEPFSASLERQLNKATRSIWKQSGSHPR
ncbi:MAG: glutamate synthase [Vampirovibrio sp.]|nr:glutamate synthase [Vampirovibrio sp.]